MTNNVDNMDNTSGINGQYLSYREVIDLIIIWCGLDEVYNYVRELKTKADFKDVFKNLTK